jgi:hypothetical protein
VYKRQHLLEPARVGDVAGADDLDALELGPFGQVLEGQVAAGGAREVGMDVEVGDEVHGGSIAQAMTEEKRTLERCHGADA